MKMKLYDLESDDGHGWDEEVTNFDLDLFSDQNYFLKNKSKFEG